MQGLRNKQGRLSIEQQKAHLVCGRAESSRSEQNVGTHVDKRLPMVMHSPVDIHRYSI